MSLKAVGAIIFLKVAGVELLFTADEIQEAKKRIEELNHRKN